MSHAANTVVWSMPAEHWTATNCLILAMQTAPENVYDGSLIPVDQAFLADSIGNYAQTLDLPPIVYPEPRKKEANCTVKVSPVPNNCLHVELDVKMLQHDQTGVPYYPMTAIYRNRCGVALSSVMTTVSPVSQSIPPFEIEGAEGKDVLDAREFRHVVNPEWVGQEVVFSIYAEALMGDATIRSDTQTVVVQNYGA